MNSLKLEREEKALIQARPKLTCEIFPGDAGTWGTFQRNQKEIYKMFEKEGEGQQIFQLSKILSSDLATTVMSFSRAQDGAREAIQYLNMKFNSPHLLPPKVYEEIKDLSPARSQANIPRVAEWLLRQVESISALQQGDGKSLPADVTQGIFNALNLNLEEKKAVLPLLQDNSGVTISVMMAYIANRFKTYEMIA